MGLNFSDQFILKLMSLDYLFLVCLTLSLNFVLGGRGGMYIGRLDV